jgi:hypothetical protein
MSQPLRYVQGALFADVLWFWDADEFISAPSKPAFGAIVHSIPVGTDCLMRVPRKVRLLWQKPYDDTPA